MKTLRFLTFFTLLFFSLSSIAQLPFTADYSTTTPSPFVGTNTQGTLSLASNSLVYNYFQSSQNYRFQQVISPGLGNNLLWKAHFEFKLDPVNTGDYGAILFALNSSSSHFITDQSASSISLWYGDVLGGNSNTYLFIRTKRNSTWDLASDKIYISSDGNTTYYATIERTSSTEFIFALFSDPNRNDLIHKLCYIAEGAVNLDNPDTYLQQGVSTSASLNRRCNGYIKDLTITSDNELTCDECKTTACLIHDSSDPCSETFFNCSNASLSSVITYGDGKYSYFNNSTSTQHQYSSPGYYDVCVISYSYFLNEIGDYECCSDKECYEISADNLICPPGEPSSQTNLDLPTETELTTCHAYPLFTEIDLCSRTFQFTDISTVGPGNMFIGGVIDYGDGHSDQIGLNQVKNHTYENNGNYEVCLTIFTSIVNLVDVDNDPSTPLEEVFECCSERHCISIVVADCPIEGKPGNLRLKRKSEEIYNSVFSIHPNPFNNQFSILVEEGISEIQIYNAAGARVRTVLPNGNTKLRVDLSDEPNGIFLIRAIKAGEVITKKVVKQ